MEYFILEQKENIPNTVKPLVMADNAHERKQVITKEQAEEINDITTVPVVSNVDNIYPDVIDTPIFMVSDVIRKLLQLYDDTLVYKCAVLTDAKLKQQNVYWLTLMDQIDCLAPTTELNKDGSLKKMVLDSGKVKGRRMFRVGGIREKIVVINLDIAESLLRRFLLGVQLTQVERM